LIKIKAMSARNAPAPIPYETAEIIFAALPRAFSAKDHSNSLQ
jgi:hypothetical protein